MVEITKAVQIALTDSLGIKEGEKVLIITDQNFLQIANPIMEASQKITDSEIMIAPIGKTNGEEPPENIKEKMLEYDVILIATTVSWTHTNAVKQAAKNKTRIATLPGITLEIMQRTLNVDYEKMAVLTNKIKNILDKGKKVRITTELGTDIKFSIDTRNAEAGTGMLKMPGLIGNLPAGEAYIAPLENTANGTYIIDASILQQKVDQPITIKVKNGFAVDIQGGKIAQKLKQTLKDINNKNAFNIAELGIGTNPSAIITGNTLEDEKVKNTAHIALGKSSSFGGTIDVPVHIDGIMTAPTIYIDDTKIMEKGEFLI